MHTRRKEQVIRGTCKILHQQYTNIWSVYIIKIDSLLKITITINWISVWQFTLYGKKIQDLVYEKLWKHLTQNGEPMPKFAFVHNNMNESKTLITI